MGIEVYQSVGGASVAPGSTRWASRVYIPNVAAPASGYIDYWRTPLLGSGLGTLVTQQGVGANFTYPVDVVAQLRYMRHTHAGFATLCTGVTDAFIAATQPLLATGVTESPVRRVIISEMLWRWEAGGYTLANSGSINGIFFGTANAGFWSFTDPVNAAANVYCGIVRRVSGTFWGWKANGGAAQLFPIPGYDPTQWARIQHRFIAANATEPARYQLRIGGVLIGEVLFSVPTTPRYDFTNDRGVIPFYLSSNAAGFDAGVPPMNWRSWEVIIGQDNDGTY